MKNLNVPRISRDSRILIPACLLAACAGALIPGDFRLDAWLFGAVLVISSSLLALLFFYRRLLRRPSSAVGPALAVGLGRFALVIAALSMIVLTEEHPLPFVWATLAAYVVMMAAEVLLVARWAGASSEAQGSK